jgi:hypothetical protein
MLTWAKAYSRFVFGPPIKALSYFCSVHWFLGLLQESGMTIIAAEDLDDAALKAVEAIKS